MIAIARHDEPGARAEAKRVNDIDPALPMPEYVEGLIRYNANQFADAVPFLQQALQKNASSTIQIPELRYYLGDALARVDRYAEAEPVLLDEVRLFPHDLRARAGLAMLYRATGRATEADRQIDAIERVAPGAEGHALAGKLRRMFRSQ
jgi:tetratricopeptide (TPR) repeat protein